MFTMLGNLHILGKFIIVNNCIAFCILGRNLPIKLGNYWHDYFRQIILNRLGIFVSAYNFLVLMKRIVATIYTTFFMITKVPST